MPKKDEGYEDALGSVFDFIFANNSKPNKSIPYKPTGFSGSDEMTRALAELASKPYTYMSDAALNHLNETFLGDANLLEVYIDQKDGKKYRNNYDPKASRFRLRVSDLGSAMSDPRGFVDKVDKKMKQQRRWIALTGASAMLDSAVAVGVGRKQGMSMKDAMTFGKAARVDYDPQMLELQKELTAGSAASNAMFERAKAKAIQEGIDPKSEAYQKRVFEIVKGSKSAIKSDQKMLYEAMRSGRSSRKARYFYQPSGDDLKKKPELVKAMRAEMQAATQDVEAYLKKKVGYTTPEEKAHVDSLMAQFEGELDYARRHGGSTISGYRMTYARNQGLNAQFASSQEELEKAVAAQNFTYAWERIKGGGEYADLGNSISSLGDEISYYKELAKSDPKFKPLVKDLEAHMDNLKGIKVMTDRDMRGARDYWVSPNTAFAPRAKKERVIEGATEVLKSDLTRYKFLMDNADNEADRKRFEIQFRAAQQGMGAISLVPGSEIRNRLDSYVSTYNVFTQGILQGGIGAGLIDGSSYHQKGAAGMFAPGMIGNVTVHNKSGFVLDGKGYFEVNKERVRYSGGLLVSEGGKKYSIVNGVVVDSKGRQITGSNGNLVKIDEKALSTGYHHGGLVIPRDEVNQHYARLAGMYYLTPTSMLKTALWNGEGFSYLAHRNQLSIQRAFANDRRDILSNFINSNKSLFGGVANLFDADTGEINKAVLATNYTQIIDILNTSSVKLPDGLKRILRVANRKNRAVGRFSRLGDLISRNLSERWGEFFGKGRAWIAGKLTSFFQKFTKDKLVKEQIEKFFSGAIGLRQVVSESVKAGILALANALGLATTGGLANILITAVAWIGTEAVMSLTKPLMGILIICLWGLCGLFGFILFEGVIQFPSNVAHANMPPTDVEVCGVEMYPVGPSVDPGYTYGDPPHDGICPVANTAVCTQGPNGGFSHARMGTGAIDTGYTSGLWRAPSDGRVTSYTPNAYCGSGGASYGGIMHFVDEEGNDYRLIHVVALVGLGPVDQGTAIARMSTGLATSPCWTGAHFHLDVQSNGGWVNAEEWYRGLGCNINCP